MRAGLRIACFGVGVALAAGCGSGRVADGAASQTVVTSSDGGRVYTVNAEEGTVSVLDRGSGRVSRLAVGTDPARITRAGSRLYVTVAGDGDVAVLEDHGGELVETARRHVGAEPAGIAASPDGKLLYVAITLEDRVEERDAETLDVLRSWAVVDQPRWLVVHPKGDALFVASTFHGRITRIDLDDGGTSDVPLPVTHRDTVDGSIDLTPRVTGDPGITPDGSAIAFPGLYVDDTTPVVAPAPIAPETTDVVDTGGADTGAFTGGGFGGGGNGGGYASTGLGVSRMNPVLLTFDLDAHGGIQGEGRAVFTGGIGRRSVFRSMPVAAVPTPNGKAWLVPLEGSDVVAIVGQRPFAGQGDARARPMPEETADFSVSTTGCEGCQPEVFTSPHAGGFYERPVVIAELAGGPRGVAIAGDSALVHEWLGRAVAELAVGDLEDIVQEAGKDGVDGLQDARTDPISRVVVSESALPPDVERGRALFSSATDERMAADGAGVSCATCHLGSRTDGIVWNLDGNARNTPSLAGRVSDTAPVTWEGGVASVGQEALLTSQGRMGGHGITSGDMADIGAYVDWTRPVASPRADAEAIARGADLFTRPDVGCATCHAGERHTDNREWQILDFPAQTPSLDGVVASAPYFHDGSAPTLRVVLERSRDGSMGDTSGLDDGQLSDLEAYLRSL